MFTNIHKLIEELNRVNLDNIPEHVELCFEETGFYMKGKTIEETIDLNKRYKLLISNLNKISGVEEMLTVSKIAKHLQMSPNTIYELLKNNLPNTPQLKYIQTERGVRIRNSDYYEFLHECYKNEKDTSL